ncbi:MAG: hypothetical protein HA496_07825 [Thaumarchaeota archaeon]|nr:hypothetical protein [Nitrososphaerota archaeon]
MIDILDDTYRPKRKRAKSKEEERKLDEEEERIDREIMGYIERKEWDKCLKKYRFKNKRINKRMRRLIAEMMWRDEVAKTVSEKFGVKIQFITIRGESGFESTFDSKGMSDEQILREID